MIHEHVGDVDFFLCWSQVHVPFTRTLGNCVQPSFCSFSLILLFWEAGGPKLPCLSLSAALHGLCRDGLQNRAGAWGALRGHALRCPCAWVLSVWGK